eukprot:TRINITY_DN18291_c0_g1_i1.p1 TRINITY_DN18291_c0_g1~~TRINITY_DN18291_c0_g1_i1.p1  ORF type:complete len:258 (+),score=77.49 TRINITY_DN18291_c0_g1_i1:104-877(+)
MLRSLVGSEMCIRDRRRVRERRTVSMANPPRRKLANFFPSGEAGNSTSSIVVARNPEGFCLRDKEEPAMLGGLTVHGSKKGGLPVSVQKRNKGKRVTVLGNVEGTGEELAGLLKAMKDAIGVGGSVQDGQIELQGEHAARMQEFLLANQSMVRLVNVQGAKPPSNKREQPKFDPSPAEEGGCSRDPRVAPTPPSKDQKSVLTKMVKAMDAVFLKEHGIHQCSGNQLAKLKYSDFERLWKEFCAAAPDQAWKAVTGRS